MDEATWLSSTDPQRELFCLVRQKAFCCLSDKRLREIISRINFHGPMSCLGTICWQWTGAVSSPTNYGNFHDAGKTVLAHRMIYSWCVGIIGEGNEVDHRCKNRRCVNPHHLEAVTSVVNNLRSASPTANNARKTHCIKGHAFDDSNTYLRPKGGRGCKICDREKSKRNKARRRAKGEKV